MVDKQQITLEWSAVEIIELKSNKEHFTVDDFFNFFFFFSSFSFAQQRDDHVKRGNESAHRKIQARH